MFMNDQAEKVKKKNKIKFWFFKGITIAGFLVAPNSIHP
jgi:hypothetical protein